MSTASPVTKTADNDSPATGEDAICRVASVGFRGLVARWVVCSLVMLAAAVGLALLSQNGIILPGLSVGYMAAVGLCIWKAMMLGLFFGTYPPGNDYAMIRLGLATFCRTGIPLLVVLVGLDYATRPDSATRFMLAIYMVGFFTSLVLEVRKLSGIDPPLQQSIRG